MIEAYNRRQLLRAGLALFFGLAASAVTFALFYGAFHHVLGEFGLDRFFTWIPIVVSVVMIVIYYTGWDYWRRGFGHQELMDAGLAGGFDSSTGSGTWANVETAEIRGGAYILTQIALAGPLQLLKACDLIRSRISPELGLENTLKDLLRKIEAKDRWHPISEYRGQENEVMYLIRMGCLDFSPRKGSLRPKS